MNGTSVVCVGRLQSVPRQQPHAAAVVAAADLRIQPRVRRQRDAQQLDRRVAFEGDVNTPPRAISWRGLPFWRVSHSSSAMASHSGRSMASHSLNDRARASVGLAQPEVEVRQVELAGAARNGAAMLDGATGIPNPAAAAG